MWLWLEEFGVLLTLVLGIKAVQVGVGLGFQVLSTFSCVALRGWLWKSSAPVNASAKTELLCKTDHRVCTEPG